MFVENNEEKELLGNAVAETAKAPNGGNTIMANFRNMIKKNPIIEVLRKPGTVTMVELVPPKTHEISFRPIHAHGKHDAAVYGRLVAVCQASKNVRLHHDKSQLNRIFSHTELIHLVKNGQTHRVRLKFAEKKEVSIHREDLKEFLVKTGLWQMSHATT
jgi:hypothetical protein